MTRKDYILLAAAIRACRFDGMDPVRAAIHADYANRVSDALAQDNPRFDRGRFLAAAGVTA